MDTIMAGRARFPLGRLLATPGALRACTAARVGTLDLLQRHQGGDWAEMDAEDQQANEMAVADGSRIFSRYTLPTDRRVWIITEWDRSATTLLLPKEY